MDTMSDCLQIATGCLATLKIDPAAMERGLSADMLATDLAEYLVRKGVPFRETHHISGAAVKLAEDRGCALSDLTVGDLKPLCDAFEEDVVGVWSYEKSAESRDTEGGSSRRSVLEQCEKLRRYLRDTEGDVDEARYDGGAASAAAGVSTSGGEDAGALDAAFDEFCEDDPSADECKVFD